MMCRQIGTKPSYDKCSFTLESCKMALFFTLESCNWEILCSKERHISSVFTDSKEQSNRLYRDLLFGKLEVNEGMMMENVVAQMLHASGHALYFYSRYSKTEADERMEVDFLIVREAPKAKVCPIEVKSTKRYATSSLDKFKKKFTSRIGTQYVLHTKNIHIDGSRVYLPLYLAAYL